MATTSESQLGITKKILCLFILRRSVKIVFILTTLILVVLSVDCHLQRRISNWFISFVFNMNQVVTTAVMFTPAASSYPRKAVKLLESPELFGTLNKAKVIRFNSKTAAAARLNLSSSTYSTTTVKSIPVAKLLMMSYKTNATSSTKNLTVAKDIMGMSNHILGVKSRVSCVATVFVECELPNLRKHKTPNFTFGIALLRQPSWIPDSQFNFKICPYSNCVYQGSEVSFSTKLVVVNVVDLKDHYRPPPRWPHQIYVANTYESPVHTRASFLSKKTSVWNRAFNLTATYRMDSDLFLPYGKLLFNPVPQGKLPNYYEIAKKKTKMAVWFVSHCNAHSGRDEYVQQMREVIDIDIFGECGRPCPESGTMCSTDIPVSYRYYLSFENSLCEDYVTEKFFKMFKGNNHILPVVRGSFDYNKHMPRNTFINAADFKSATKLAEYLKYLAGDTVAYSRYLETKDSYRYLHVRNLGCAACEFLNTRTLKSKTYNMKKWMRDGQCHLPNDL